MAVKFRSAIILIVLLWRYTCVVYRYMQPRRLFFFHFLALAILPPSTTCAGAKNIPCELNEKIKLTLANPKLDDRMTLTIPCGYLGHFEPRGEVEFIRFSFVHKTKEPYFKNRHLIIREQKVAFDPKRIDVKVTLGATDPSQYRPRKELTNYTKEITDISILSESSGFDVFIPAIAELPFTHEELFPRDDSTTYFRCVRPQKRERTRCHGYTDIPNFRLQFSMHHSLLADWRIVEGNVIDLVNRFNKR